MKKFTSIMLLVAMTITMSACQGGSVDLEKTNVIGKTDLVPMEELKTGSVSEKVGYQLDAPKEGEEIAVITTNMGTIKMRFFPEAAPKTVYNFKKHAQDGYYNGIIFHRIIPNFMIQTGDPAGNGTGGESVWGGSFADEFSDKLLNITGSVSMANAGKDTNGSQFFINNAEPGPNWDELKMVYEEYYLPNKDAFNQQYGGTVDTDKLTDNVKKLYDANGGNINLDGFLSTAKKGHTVFAQVFEGMDIVDAISKVTTGTNDKPEEDVIMEKVEIIPYTK